MDKFELLSGHAKNRKGMVYKLFDKGEMSKMQK
jgi:hypothetical protein